MKCMGQWAAYSQDQTLPPFSQAQGYGLMCPFFGLKSVFVLYKLQQFLYERTEA